MGNKFNQISNVEIKSETLKFRDKNSLFLFFSPQAVGGKIRICVKTRKLCHLSLIGDKKQ